jgi:hypothetical protein
VSNRVPQGLSAGLATSTRDRAGGSEWRETLRLLYAYLRRNMTDAATDRARLYPKTHKGHILKPVPFVYRLARELATLYVRPPVRRWKRKDGGDLPQSAIDRIEATYKGAQVDRRMRVFHEHMVGLNQGTLWVWPIERANGLKAIRIMNTPPHEQAVELGDPTSDSEKDVAKWWVRLPVRQDPWTGQTIYGIAEFTRGAAVWIDGPAEVKDKGVWVEDGTHPVGDIPGIIGRNSPAGDGEFWAPAPDDILAAQRAMTNDHTDVGHVARLQGYGVPVLTGMSADAVSELEIGPETIVGLPDNEGDFKFANANPDITGYLAQSESYTKAVVAGNGLNPAAYMKTTAATAIAKKVELLDRDAERVRHVDELVMVEQRLYNLIRRWLNALHGTEWLPEAIVTVEYREPVVAADPLHDAQAADLELKNGLTSRAQIVASREGLTLDEAEERVAANLASQRAHAPDDDDPPDDGNGNLVGLTGGGRTS